jgi:hypothetical protein
MLGAGGKNTRLYVWYKITKFYAICYDNGRGHSSANVCAQGIDTYADMLVAFQMIALLREKILNSRRTILRR